MTIGIPKEVKTDEFRVGLTPLNVAELVKNTHKVYVQRSAGDGSDFSDKEYIDAGAQIVADAKTLYEKSELIVKVKEPQKSEYPLLNKKHTLFCYLHLAPLKELTSVLIEKKLCAIAYETVTIENELPLLKPMSEIAGKMAPLIGANYLSRYQGGRGILISGAEGADPAKVLIIGAGNAGFNAAKIALGMGADVSVINRSMPRLEHLKKSLPSAKIELFSHKKLLSLLKEADIIISSVLIHGGSATPKLITKETLSQMKKGSIIVDITIDQGGISESSHPTTHTKPIFIQEGVLHYCVANMPGAYPTTATIALTNATFPYILELANSGTTSALKNNKALNLGVNICNGIVTNRAVARIHGFEFHEFK